MPKVSVLMPIWNTKEEHLREAIESILNQTFKDFEYLILNDSPDNTRLDEIVASYNDSRIQYKRNENNMGITPSRNKLLKMAEGDYIAIFDHDDVSEPTRLEKQVAYLDSHPEVGVVGSCARTYPQKAACYIYPKNDDTIRELMMDACSILHPASMIRKSVLIEHSICYEEEYTPCEDYRLWLRLMEFTKFHNIQEALFNYRVHDTNTSRIMNERMSKVSYELLDWAREKYSSDWRRYTQHSTRKKTIRLFGIPIIHIYHRKNRTKISVLGITVISIKEKIQDHPALVHLKSAPFPH